MANTTLVLGTVQWGLPYGVANKTGQPTRDDLKAMLRLAQQHGIQTLDTARAYGSSEETIGSLIGDDDAFRIISKLTPTIDETPNKTKLAIDQAEESLTVSLNALRRSRIDVLLLHRAHHRHLHGGAVWTHLMQRQKEGLIGKLGISAGSPDEALAALDDGRVQAIQVAASLFDQRLMKQSFFNRARASGREVFIRSIYLQGVAFLDPQRVPGHLATLKQPLQALREFASAHQHSVGELFFRYAAHLQCPLVVGSETTAQLQDNIRMAALGPLASSTIAQLEALTPSLPDEILNPARWKST